MTAQIATIMTLTFIATLGLAYLAMKWGTSKIEAEHKELKGEEFTLRKQMLHDKHRLAYIVARRKMLDELTPPAPAGRFYDSASREP